MSDYQPSPTWVPTSKIIPGYYFDLNVYSRASEDAENWAALTDSIKRHGMIDPLITTSGLELVSGTRRLAAAKHLGIAEVPVIAREDAELFNALRYDAQHPSKPELVVDGTLEDKLKQGLLIYRLLSPYLNELKSLRIAKNQAEQYGRKYNGPDIPEINGESLPAIVGLTVNRWTKLRFLSMAVGAKPPINPRSTFNHNAEKARKWLDFAIRTAMLDKAALEYGRECRPAGWEEKPRKRTHPTDAPVTASPERFVRTYERSAAVMNDTLAGLEHLGGVPDKVTFDQLMALVAELNTTVREATKLRLRLNAAITDRKFGDTPRSSKS